jgi:hypothetical protein
MILNPVGGVVSGDNNDQVNVSKNVFGVDLVVAGGAWTNSWTGVSGNPSL